MSMRSRMLLLTAMAIAMDSNSNKIYKGVDPGFTPEDKENRSKEIDQKKLNDIKGLKEFDYGGNKVWAINKKNADRKAKKNNWI